MPQGLITGDFDGNNSIGITDLIIAIRAFNLLNDSYTQLANKAFGRVVNILDIVAMIRNYQNYPSGDPL